MIQKEIEKKWLVKLPKSWGDMANLLDGIVDVERIYQVYLIPEKAEEQAARVRKTIKGLGEKTSTVFHYNKKKPLETAVHQELEYEISKKDYEKHLKDANPNKCGVEKIRYVFNWHDQIFELDIFKGHLKGLAILEVELKDKKQKVELPPFLSVVKEITGDKKYSNFSLADKK